MSSFTSLIALGCAAILLSMIGTTFIFARSQSKRRASERAVERLRNLPGGKPLTPLPAASPEVLLPVCGEVPSTLEHAQPLEVQRTVTVSQAVSAAVQPTLERAEPQIGRAHV